MGVINSEGDLEVQRSPVQSVFYYRYFNPIGLFFGVRKDRSRNLSNINQELVTEMSDIVNYLSVKEKQNLTIKSRDSTLTPQQSFIHFFSHLDLSYVNPVLFKSKFIDMYSRRGEEGLNDFLKTKNRGELEINRFGANFASLTDKKEYQPNNYSYKSKNERVKIKIACFFQKLRRFKRCVLSSVDVH